MIGILVHASEALCVDHNYVHVFVGSAGDGLLPEPQSLGARINGRAYLEASFLLVQQHPIHKERFACSILTNDRHHSYPSVGG